MRKFGLVYEISEEAIRLFAIDFKGSGAFLSSPDFESPGDANGDNLYEFDISFRMESVPPAKYSLTVTDLAESPQIDMIFRLSLRP